MSLALLPLEMQKQVKEQLHKGETVKWTGQPVGGGIRPGSRRLMTILSVLFIAGGAVGTLAIWDFQWPAFDDPQDFVALIAVGLGLLLGIGLMSMLVLAQRLNDQVVYVLTDQRAFMLHPLLGEKPRGLDLEKVETFEVDEQDDGSGTLLLRSRESRGGEMDPGRDLAFPATPEVRRVEMVLRDLLRRFRGRM